MAKCKQCLKEVGCGCNLIPKYTGVCGECYSENMKKESNATNTNKKQN